MSTPMNLRRFALVLLVPAIEYLCLESCRRGLNIAIAISPALGIAMLPIVLVVSVITAAVIVLFFLEFFNLLGNIKKRFTARLCLLLIYGWIMLPLYLLKHFGSK